MESIGILNPSNDVDIFCLHTVASQLLSKIVAEFQQGWNRHPLSTEHNLSPIQLFWQGLLKLKAQGGNHVEFSQVLRYTVQMGNILLINLNIP